MSQRKTTAPPTPKHSRSSLSSRKGLIATEKTKKQSAKRRTALDNRFHRTLSLSRIAGEGGAKRRVRENAVSRRPSSGLRPPSPAEAGEGARARDLPPRRPSPWRGLEVDPPCAAAVGEG